MLSELDCSRVSDEIGSEVVKILEREACYYFGKDDGEKKKERKKESRKEAS